VTSTTKKTPRRLAVESDPAETQTKILDAAFRQLATKGYASLSMREIAKDAGVNHALINYYFRSKDQLVIAVLDEANRQLLERQHKMYDAPSTFAEKWAEARRFYKDDVASGFVRVQAELWAASMSDEELRE
jgi:AcrR family transcriptional regulator